MIGGPIALPLKVVDQPRQVLVFWNDRRELLSVLERRIYVLNLTVEADERHQGVAVARVSSEAFLKDRYRICGPSARMQRHRTDVGIACAVGLAVRRGPRQDA